MKSFEEHLAREEYNTDSRDRAAAIRRKNRALTRMEREQNKGRLALRLAVIVWAVILLAVVLRGSTKGLPMGKDTTPTEMPTERPTETIVEVVEESVEDPADPPVSEDSAEALAHLPSIENATLTHYCICEKCCGKLPSHPAFGITASGREAEPYVSVAVDPFLIPLGSKIYIQYSDGEIREYRADDTGSAITGAHLDLCVTDHEEALAMGVKTVRVWWEE